MSAPHTTGPEPPPLLFAAPAVNLLPAGSERSRGRLSERSTRSGSVRECAGTVCRFGRGAQP
eukprot:2584314-Prymnesium_polylepis.1